MPYWEVGVHSITLGIRMKVIRRLLGVFLCFLTVVAIAQDLKATGSAISILKVAQPTVTWDAETTTLVDVTCDGKADTIIVGYEKDEAVWLGVVYGNKNNLVSKPLTMSFRVGKHSQDSFCSVPVQIKTYPINCSGDGEALPGCINVKGCSSFAMADNTCDSFHFYWNNSLKELQWWRM